MQFEAFSPPVLENVPLLPSEAALRRYPRAQKKVPPREKPCPSFEADCRPVRESVQKNKEKEEPVRRFYGRKMSSYRASRWRPTNHRSYRCGNLVRVKYRRPNSCQVYMHPFGTRGYYRRT